jgi:hypothetical protein
MENLRQSIQGISLRPVRAGQGVQGFGIDFFTFGRGVLGVLEDAAGI